MIRQEPSGPETQYESLNDAADHLDETRYKEGEIEIWYVKPEDGKDFRLGVDWIREQGSLPSDLRDLAQTHRYLGSVQMEDHEEIFRLMQGMNWSPEGEARNLIKKRGLAHTSMSVGDAIVQGNDIFLVDNVGFEKLSLVP